MAFIYTYKAWTPSGSPANTGVHAFQPNNSTGKIRAGSIQWECGLCTVEILT